MRARPLRVEQVRHGVAQPERIVVAQHNVHASREHAVQERDLAHAQLPEALLGAADVTVAQTAVEVVRRHPGGQQSCMELVVHRDDHMRQQVPPQHVVHPVKHLRLGGNGPERHKCRRMAVLTVRTTHDFDQGHREGFGPKCLRWRRHARQRSVVLDGASVVRQWHIASESSHRERRSRLGLYGSTRGSRTRVGSRAEDALVEWSPEGSLDRHVGVLAPSCQRLG
mmetsp:Transcript_13195/g.55241  ORF Transcript_13195/g.55241 Transcript_13195/m.55241 type:complete len:225 (+) Transcript_13195:6847-7521(+)